MTLNTEQISEYLNEHLPYRLNSLRAWDLYISRREAQTYEEEDKSKKCYWEKEFLEPAFEISIVFGRSLLNFLGIKRDGDMLKTFESHEITHMEKDSVFIWHINPGKKAYPLKNINSDDQKHLYNLIKVANKSAAHLTIKTSSKKELESLEAARRIIYKLIFDYVDGLNKQAVW